MAYTFNTHSLAFLAILASSLLAFIVAAEDSANNEQKRMLSYVPLAGFDEFSPYDNFYGLLDNADDRPKRDDSARPGLLRFGKRDAEIPGLLRFGKRSETMAKKEMPGVLRFGKRNSDMPGVLRFGKRSDMPGVLRFGKRSDMPGVLRFGKRSDMPGVLRFGRK
jgi:hypothetical protein